MDDFADDLLKGERSGKYTPIEVSHLLTVPVSAQDKPAIPSHGKLVPLFNGKDLAGFDTMLEKQGINNDPNKVFQVENGVLHISGQEFGGLVTQKEYGNYYLRAEFKWGEKTYPPRDGKARDSGIQFNITGPLKVWPRMMEFQINEGGTGVTVGGKAYQSTSSGTDSYFASPTSAGARSSMSLDIGTPWPIWRSPTMDASGQMAA